MVQEFAKDPLMVGIRLALAPFPATKGAGIYDNLTRQGLLAHPQRATHPDDMLPEALALSRKRDVPKELDGLCDESESWGSMPLHTVGYSAGVNTKPLGNSF